MKKVKQKEAFEIASSYQFDTEKIELGPWTSYSLLTDPRHMSFVLARYKFASKMMKQGGSVLEVGCGDAFGAPILKQNASKYLGIDVDERLIHDNSDRLKKIENLDLSLHDSTSSKMENKYDTVLNIDVLEHLDSDVEEKFLVNSINSLDEFGVYICGTPSIYSKDYASEQSAIQHINLKSAPEKKELFEKYFNFVWIFSMNDELVHTGFSPMAHYLFAVCAGKK